MKKIISLIAFAPLLAVATQNDLLHRPKSFTVAGGKAVFVDFTEANYTIVYDLNKKQASVTAEIKFNAPEAGLPIFDSVETPSSIALDGESVAATLTKTPNSETNLRVISKSVTTGGHDLKITVPLTELVSFENGVKSAFWTSDLDDRNYLERYMPANFEFDQVKMSFDIQFLGAKSRQVVYTNGVVNSNGNGFKIQYPSYYTASSIFFHTVPAGTFDEQRFSLKSLDGREIPVVLYTGKSSWVGGSLSRMKQEVTNVFHELESDYGAFPHPSITVYQAGSGGMEYCGATMTDFSSVGHELFHSYFARGVMPANGNSGWLDEALASWRDGGYKTLTSLSGSSRMSSHPYYTRLTDMAAYSFGERFMRFLDGKLKDKGGLKPFMRHMIDKRVFSPLFVEEFSKEMGAFYGVSVDAEFKRYTYGAGNAFSPELKFKTNQVHRKMSLQELKRYL